MSWYPGKASRGTPVIPYGPGLPYETEAAVVAAFPVGTPVYDMAETVGANKLKRINNVANLDGADTVNFGFVLPANGTTDPWELEWLMAIDGMPSTFDTVFSSIVSGTNTRHFRTSFDNVVSKIYADWRTSSGTSFVSRSAIDITDGKFRKYLVAVSSDLKGRFFVDGVMQGTDADLSSWVPGTATAFKISGAASSGSKTFTKICNMVASRNGAVLANVPFSDGAGAVATDKSGNGYNGTITDASPTTFWNKACVPIALGG
jgi:hypothetical protein